MINFSLWVKKNDKKLCKNSCSVYGRIFQVNLLVADALITSSHGIVQYHGCWCPGDLRHQAINSHDIDSVG